MSKINKLTNKFNLINEIIIIDDIKCHIKKLLFNLYYSLIINVNNDSIIPDLLKYIFYTIDFHYIKYNGLPFYETNNIWNINRRITDRPYYDINEDCYTSSHLLSDCKFKPTIYPEKRDTLKFYYIKEEDFPLNNLFIDDFHNKNIIETINFFIANNMCIKKILLIGYDRLTIKNISNSINNHLGSDHCNIKLPFLREIMIDKYIDFKQLIDYYYIIKKNKWDKNFEVLNDVLVLHDKNNIEVFLDFYIQ